MANMITGGRILCSVALLCVPLFSPMFYVLYGLAGLTDMLDGAVARKTGTVSEFGAKLDTAADAVFVAACAVKLFPALTLPVWLWVWVGAIAAIKAVNVISGVVLRGSFVAEHTRMNRITGAALFALPLTLELIDCRYSASAVCALATLAAVQEGHLVRTKNDAQRTNNQEMSA